MSIASTIRRIHLATDHAGLAHKDEVREWLKGEGYEVIDHGAIEFNDQDDFPDYIVKAAAAVSAAAATDVAIIFGGSGQGEAILANRFSGVRAAVYYGGPDAIVTLSREHNDANVLSIGARFVAVDDVKRVVWTWLHTDMLSEEKYTRRNQKLEAHARTHHERTC